MKRKLWLHHLIGAFFAFALSVSTVGCLATGFKLPVTSLGSLFIFCGLLALSSALLFRFKYGGTALLCLSALAGFLLWKMSALPEQLQTQLLAITTEYHLVYGWPALGIYAAEKTDLALLIVGWWTAVSVSFCICRRRHILTALPSVILPLVLCLIVTHTVPDTAYLYLLILFTALLLLTDWVRRSDLRQGIALTLRMALPVAAALALLFSMNPREGYIYRAANLHQDILDWFQQLDFSGEGIQSGTIAAVSKKLDLRNVGPKNDFSFSVMRVTSPIDGTLYLRGCDYDSYDGIGWEASTERIEKFTAGGSSYGQLTITTYGTRGQLYIPYYATDTIELRGGYAENEDNLTRYSFNLATYPKHSQTVIDGTSITADYVIDPDDHYYLNLGSSRDWAGPLALKITEGCATQDEVVQAIGDYVRRSASYDLNTSRMSDGSEDFARWFLEESDTGYCVHFATAATVLLRAAGIEARYVEGYMVTCQAGEAVVVSNRDAHAWTEYYDTDSNAWRVLEATPADENSPVQPEMSVTTEPTETDPPETEAETTAPGDTKPSTTEPAPGATTPAEMKEPVKLPTWPIALLLSLTALLLQGELRLSIRRKQWNRGTPNERALTRWRQCGQLAKLMDMELPEELDALAQKAKFSQHTLSREELLQFELFRREALRRLKDLPRYRKWLLRLLYAIG